jgi:hypothetical protein
MAAQYTARLVQNSCDQRAFQSGVRKIEIEQPVDVVGPGPYIPLIVADKPAADGLLGTERCLNLVKAGARRRQS